MKKSLFPIFVSLLSAFGTLPMMADETNDRSTEMRIGYAVPDNEGLNLGMYIHIIYEGAIEYPAEEMTRLAGNNISKIRVKVGNELSVQNNFVFITDDLEGEPLYKQKVDRFDYGWNEVSLDQPFEIDGRKLFIGFRYESTGEVLSLDGEDDNNKANWIRLSQDAEGAHGVWNHQGGGALNIQAVLEGESLPQNDIRIESHNIRSYAGVRETTPMSIVIRNMGASTVHSIGVTLTVDDETLPMRTIDGLNIKSNDMAVVNIGDLEMTMNNIFDVVVDVTEVNGKADERSEDNSVTVKNIISRKDYTARKVLLEHFSTMQCANCPSGHATIDDALRYRDNVIHVIYHAAYGTDPLTIPAAETYMQLFSNGQSYYSTYAPAAALDRTNMANYGATDGDQGTECPAFFPRRETMGRLIDTRLSSAALITVNIDHTYDPVTRKLTVSVSGNIPNGSVSRLNANDPRLTVMITEDGVEGYQKGITVPMEGPYIHNHALRGVISGVWGDPMTFDGGDYTSSEYSITVPAAWNPEKLRIVAFVSDYDPIFTSKWQVFNAEEVEVNATTGIDAVTSDYNTISLTIENGCIILPENAVSAQIYSIDGTIITDVENCNSLIEISHLAKGIYIISVDMPDKKVSSKIVLQ